LRAAVPAGRGRAALLLVAGLAAAGCAGPPREPPADPPPAPREPVERAYLPPEGPPPPPPTLAVAAAPGRAIAALADALGGAGRGVRSGTAEAGVAWLALTSSGDPEPFLDCGSFELRGETGGVGRVPAASLSVRIPLLPAERREVLLRQLRLDGRLLVTALPEGRGSRLEARASYVLTRTVDRVALDGRVLDSQRQTIAFATGERGAFDQGLVCRPTGRLEAAALEAAATRLSPAGAAGGAAPGGS
jgi:hypothetical protein